MTFKADPTTQYTCRIAQLAVKVWAFNICPLSLKGIDCDKHCREEQQTGTRNLYHSKVWTASCGSFSNTCQVQEEAQEEAPGGKVLGWLTVVAKNGRIWGGGKSGKDNESGGDSALPTGACCVLPRGQLWSVPSPRPFPLKLPTQSALPQSPGSCWRGEKNLE